MPTAISHFADTVGIAALVRQGRRRAQAVEANHADAAARASELAIERAPVRSAWTLHDRVLQTLATVATGSWIIDPNCHAYLADDHLADQLGDALHHAATGSSRHLTIPGDQP